jgi:hypothetical protein
VSAVFCRDHAFYDCPVCRGEDLAWVIPVEEHGKIVGELRVPMQGEPSLTGEVHIPWEQGPSPFRDVPVAVPVPVSVDPPEHDLLQRVEEKLPETGTSGAFERLVTEPRFSDAAARGRRVHERALSLSEVENIPYEEALVLVLEGR